ncbi:hypothetical protein [Methylophilus sp. OH31]|uniref:hypothetical protein n=1 Tax=Methylophilus sp. OH31 TaxID=1387312 RepID=UPI0011DE04EA|nr:hypothetical protein [Methylophilus sp. OH31]
MIHKISVFYILGVLMLCICHAAQSNPSPKPIDMLQVQIGKPFPYTAAFPGASDSMASQLGFYTFNAPNSSNSKLPFVDYQVAINNSTHAVYYVRGTRQYSEMNGCLESLRIVSNLLAPLYGTSVKDINSSTLMRKSSDTLIEAMCSYKGLSPYVELSLNIQSESQYKEIDNNINRKYAR